MGDRKTYFNSTSHKIESRQDACRTYDPRNVQDLLPRSLVNHGGHFSAEVGGDRNFDVSVFQHKEGVFLRDWPVGGFAVAGVSIYSVWIKSCGDGSACCQPMREDIVFVLKRDNVVQRLGCQARGYENVGKQVDSQPELTYMPIR